MTTTPSQILAEALRAHGTDTAFGVPGGGPNLDVVGALNDVAIRFVLAHAETAACIMASVYGYLTGRVSPCIVTRGPGAASAVNGVAQATLDRHPLVLVSDTVSEASAHRVPHQRIDQQAMLAPVAKLTATLGAGAAAADLAALIGVALSSPAGAVHLDYDASSTKPLPAPPQEPDATTSAPSASLTSAVSDLVAGATSPVLILGLGACAVAEDLLPLIEALGAPVLTTYQGIGVVPTEHDLCAGLFTNGASERPLIERADLIVAIGLDVVEPIPAAWNYTAPVVSISATAMSDPYLPLAAELVGDVAALAAEVTEELEASGWPDSHALAFRTQTRDLLGAHSESVELGPLELVAALAANLPERVTTTVDAGAHFLAIMPFWPVSEPKRLLISNGLATMGYAVPAAIGAALARPDERVVCLVGDGGLGMSLAELETIVRLELPITVVVFNDAALSLIKIKQRTSGDDDATLDGGEAAVRYRQTDFAGVAHAVGMPATTVSTEAEVAAALAGIGTGPQLIDARIDPAAYAHLIKVTRG